MARAEPNFSIEWESQLAVATYNRDAMSLEAAPRDSAPDFDRAANIAAQFVANIETVIYGKPEEIKARGRCAWRAAGTSCSRTSQEQQKRCSHARWRGRIVGATTGRIQCTPDLQPTDVTGLSVYNQKSRDFEFRPGPIFANVVLVDEINRAMPKTQSALLEAMAEGQVTVDGATRGLPRALPLARDGESDRVRRHVPAP